MRRFKGFTLTELMVALAVIGILVAVVTPAIMKTRPNKNKMMVKKSFYITEQIVSSLINDERLYPDMRDACGEGVVADANYYCAYGFDYKNKVTYEGEDYEGDKKFAELFKSRLNVKSEIANSDGLKFYTTDGVYWDLTGLTGDDVFKRGEEPGKFEYNQSDAPSNAGIIQIDVDTSNDSHSRQSDEGVGADGFDTYNIQILSNGKLRIDPADRRAVEFATINTSIRDTST